ncbi:hypothetical protein DFH07DRAFT_959215 [Mycena maculata]|uniref:Uncharacterized protein n=1 Tax=Mycena maculata TaxID=230809 RepID=A0AAD7J3R0_9AGAR|nr:hypothetical protein DFH07DRAFT_959215 [Mycena maculata]
MDLNNPLMNFDHDVYDLDFSTDLDFGMDLGPPTNPSPNGGLGLADAFGMRPLQTPRFMFPPVHGYGVPPARDSLALTGDDSALGMPPLLGSFGVDGAYDAYMAINYAMPQLPNPNPQDYDLDDRAEGMAPPGALGEATNTEQPAQGRTPKPARKTRKKKDAADAGA